MAHKLLLAMILAAMFGGGAQAQTTGQRMVIDRLRQEGPVRVQLSMQLFVPGLTDDSVEAEKGRTHARRLIYELAAKECDLLRAAIAKDCRLASINVNFYRRNQQTLQGYSVNGSMNFQITLK
jgi:hypothetical protein